MQINAAKQKTSTSLVKRVSRILKDSYSREDALTIRSTSISRAEAEWIFHFAGSKQGSKEQVRGAR